VIYLGSHENAASRGAAVVLPGLALAERESTFTNAEGRVLRSDRAVPGPLQAKEDWRILRALSDRFPTPLAYDTLAALRGAMGRADGRYAVMGGGIAPLSAGCGQGSVTVGLFPVAGVGRKETADPGLVLVVEAAFYRDDAVTRVSPIMNRLARMAGSDSLWVHPAAAAAWGVKAGQRVRVAHGERAVEMVLAEDGRVPEGVALATWGSPGSPVQDLGVGEGQGYPVVTLVGLTG
ncbi:MAG: molybdopterin-dependent oxidoreductase, partial [Magnetococcales bacterium]|nr:molybdopterin-dependent oxidoreductase [Magnetococcales bacterium]